MREAKIEQEKLEIWADYLLNHSLGGITKQDRVMIKGERITWPLMDILERKVIQSGAVPDVYLVPPNNERGRIWSANMGRLGRPGQLAGVPSWHTERYQSMTKYVEVLGAEDPSQYAKLTAAELGALVSADAPFSALRLSKPWVITLYPTPGFAEVEGLALEEYVDFIVRASTTDPAPLRIAEERLAPLFETAETMTIVTEHPSEQRELSLTLDLSQSRPVMSYGLRNFPDGEIFTSPNANSAQGEIYIDLPIYYNATDIQGIYLRLDGGRIVEYSAQLGAAALAAIIETDGGSKRLGEVALGMNPGLDRVIKHPLFVEKVGGTLHIAIGKSYDEGYVADPSTESAKATLRSLTAQGVFNESAQHVDIVADFRPGGCGRKVKLDDRELVVENGIWVPR